jgi:hypothetical protein
MNYFKTFMLAAIFAQCATVASAQVPGCHNGVLSDPKAYFFSLIGREEGQPADDFAEVLRASGLPAGYHPNVVPTDNGYYGLTQQIGGGGRIAGRIFLPTAQPDDLGYYSHPFSPLRDGAPGHLVWEWRDLGGPPYAPRPCGGGAVTPPVLPPTSNGQEAVLAARIASLENDLLAAKGQLAEAIRTRQEAFNEVEQRDARIQELMTEIGSLRIELADTQNKLQGVGCEAKVPGILRALGIRVGCQVIR